MEYVCEYVTSSCCVRIDVKLFLPKCCIFLKCKQCHHVPSKQRLFRKVFSILLENDYDVLMVAADSGKSFGDLTLQYLGRLKREDGTMIAVCTHHYGEMTNSPFSSHEELKWAYEYKSFMRVLPLKVEDTYPPNPPCGPEHKLDKKKQALDYIDAVFKPSVVYLDCRDESGQLKSERDIAAAIAKELRKYKV